MSSDRVDRIIEQWNRERPDLDPSPMGVIGRLHRVAAMLDAELRAVFAELGLGDGDFDVLATLRRSGPPFQLTAVEIAASTMVTSGAATKRIDRLERRGLVSRSASPSDRRSRLITLTDAGRATIDLLVERHLANEHRLVAMLQPEERDLLAAVLKRWGQALGGD